MPAAVPLATGQHQVQLTFAAALSAAVGAVMAIYRIIQETERRIDRHAGTCTLRRTMGIRVSDDL